MCYRSSQNRDGPLEHSFQHSPHSRCVVQLRLYIICRHHDQRQLKKHTAFQGARYIPRNTPQLVLSKRFTKKTHRVAALLLLLFLLLLLLLLVLLVVGCWLLFVVV